MQKIALFLALFTLSLTACSQQEIVSRERQLNYPKEKEKVLVLQENLAARYQSAGEAEKAQIVSEAKEKLFSLITRDLIPCWYGTKWDYNGTSETPGQGAIACGYFVTTVLRDAGFQLNRYKYAQMASEPMILKLTPKVKRFSGADYATVEKYIEKVPYGIFIAGLDNHTGFIVKTKDSIHFVHSVAYEDVDGVVSQELTDATIFNLSNYKILGEILQDEIIVNWLEKVGYE